MSRESRTMREHKSAVLNMFFGDPEDRPLPDPLLLIILEIAGLAHLGHRLMTYTLFFPRLIQRRRRRHDSLESSGDGGLP